MKNLLERYKIFTKWLGIVFIFIWTLLFICYAIKTSDIKVLFVGILIGIAILASWVVFIKFTFMK